MANIILFGETGSGKSSLVNLIVGKDVAKVSTSAAGCTFQYDAYKATIDETTFTIYDTAGLNEGEQGRVPHWTAIRKLYKLIRRLEGVSLLIYSMRGRVKENSKANWTLFNKVICGGKVPTIAVMSGLDSYDDPDDWWREKDNQKWIHKNGIFPVAVGCVVAVRGRKNELEDLYKKSQLKLRNLITKHSLPEPWTHEEKEEWFAHIYEETFSGLCSFTTSRLDYSKQMRDTITEFIKETGMNQADSEKLKATLLKAEKKVRNPGFFKKLGIM